MLVEEVGSTLVNGSSDWFSDLMGRSSGNHVVVGPSRFDLHTGRGADEQVVSPVLVSLQVVLLNVLGDSIGDNLGGSDSGETGPSNVLVGLCAKQIDALGGSSDLVQVGLVSNSLFENGRHCVRWGSTEGRDQDTLPLYRRLSILFAMRVLLAF